jgi:serine/threonine protein kinase
LDSFPFEADQGKYWVTVEEYIAGGTLEQRLAAGTMDGPTVLSTVLPLAEALSHLQEKQLVHRDIKPANILFRSTGEPVLTDFGLVRILDQSPLTHDFLGMGPGTPLYAAPEQLLNEKAEIDWRTDQFALALVACRCLFGVHPFAPLGTPHDAVQMVHQRATLPSDMKAKLIDAGLPALVRALEPWAVSRFRWPDQFIAELRRPGGA